MLEGEWLEINDQPVECPKCKDEYANFQIIIKVPIDRHGMFACDLSPWEFEAFNWIKCFECEHEGKYQDFFRKE